MTPVLAATASEQAELIVFVVLGVCATAADAAPLSCAALGQLSPDRAGWAKGPEQFLMTAEEMAQWNAVKTDAQAAVYGGAAGFDYRLTPETTLVVQHEIARGDVVRSIVIR